MKGLHAMNELDHEPDAQITNSVERAASRLDMSPAWLRKEIAAGRIRAVRFGRSVRILERDLQALVEARVAAL